MNPLIGLVLFVAALAFAPTVDAQNFGGVNTVSRHFTADNERYNEQNWGVFYERRWADGAKGVQAGYYLNSFANRETENTSGDTFYVVGIYQPLRWRTVRIGGFAGPATGYRKNGLVMLLGAALTWEFTPGYRVQIVGNPVVAALQFSKQF
jgi:hypothetical protein